MSCLISKKVYSLLFLLGFDDYLFKKVKHAKIFVVVVVMLGRSGHSS